MTKTKIPLTSFAEDTMNKLNSGGCLLVSGDSKISNVMTIGWGLIGYLWGKPYFMVAVRPSRHTFEFMERTEDFTVNVPKKGMEKILSFCGSKSGREYDKFKELGLNLIKGKKVKSPIISECKINYECKVKFKTKFIPKDVPKMVKMKWYPNEDFHTIYFGEIVAAFADKDIEKS
jgi:flavin reductase (DIM6/NTAB) family NADH-FMN oxidoreductase RutF